jgi:hypothetical protein
MRTISLDLIWNNFARADKYDIEPGCHKLMEITVDIFSDGVFLIVATKKTYGPVITWWHFTRYRVANHGFLARAHFVSK